MSIDYLFEKFETYAGNEAIIFNNTTIFYKNLVSLVDQWATRLINNDIQPGNIVSLTGDYSPDAIALVIALIKNKNIIVPLTPLAEAQYSSFFDISHTQFIINLSDEDHNIISRDAESPQNNEILKNLIDQQHAGLILFTSGSTGTPKAVTHDFDKLLKKFLRANKRFKTLCFLMFDHIAGIDTYFYSLYSGGTAIFPTSRDPNHICKLIEQYRVEVLPTSPTFLNFLLLSEEYKKHDLSSLKIITFGSESMPKSLLGRLETIFKGVKLIQKYGMTELGSPASRTKEGDSAFIKIDSDKFKTKVIDGILYVKADTAMIGYLNAPSPFTEDGWFNTGDAVEVDGDYVKILGRDSEIINVGGEKVYPAEVENVIQAMDNVIEVTVYGEKNPILGNIVCADVRLSADEERKVFAATLKKYCKGKLQGYKIPAKVKIVNVKQYTERFKKIRNR